MEAQLVLRTRGQVTEMGKPLLRSAEDLVVGGANVRGNIAYINRRIVTELGGDVKDDVPSNIEGNIIGYQKETGWGKFRHPEVGRLISFVVPGGRKNDLNSPVIDAMKKERSLISYYNVKDGNGNIKYIILDNIIEDDDR